MRLEIKLTIADNISRVVSLKTIFQLIGFLYYYFIPRFIPEQYVGISAQ